MSKTEAENPPRCKFFVLRKKRHCRMLVKPGEEFCAEHQQPSATVLAVGDNIDKDNKTRVICPLDKKHTCYAHKLEKHLKICNARVKNTEPFIRKGVNSGGMLEDRTNCNRNLSTFDATEIKNVIKKVNAIFEEKVKMQLTENFLKYDIVEEEMEKLEYGPKTKKHLIQASAILGLLDKSNLIKNETCFIEFGAGRGQLSFWISQAAKDKSNNLYMLLVERDSPKHKKDNKLHNSQERQKRIRADIADLVLDKVDIIKNCDHVVGVTKHLCGVATDLALRCIANMSENRHKLEGVIMTFCCHHKCLWTPFVGRQFFEEEGLSESDFDIMRGMASWATCGSGFSRERRQQQASEEEKVSFINRETEIGLNRDEKEEIGRRCKNIINWCRMKYLESLGFKCHLNYYVESCISLENVCIVAYKMD